MSKSSISKYLLVVTAGIGGYLIAHDSKDLNSADEFIEQRNATECMAAELSVFITEKKITKKDLFEDKTTTLLYNKIEDLADEYSDREFNIAKFSKNKDTLMTVYSQPKDTTLKNQKHMAFIFTD